MKDKGLIWSQWDIGKFFGDGKSSAYVTVEPNWGIHTTTAGAPAGQVYRWFQSQSGAERNEVEIPNVKSIAIERSLDTDAAQCTIQIYNQLMDPTGVPAKLAGQLGNPGYFSPSRGTSAEARARWNQQLTDWSFQNTTSPEPEPSQALAPMALIRTYQGYGAWSNGVPVPRQTAVASGKVTITGTWIVDTTTIGSDGILTLKCRDAAKLLIDQFCYPPLVPANLYPVKYNRYVWTNLDREWDPEPSASLNDVEVAVRYHHAVSDFVFGGYNGANDSIGPNSPVQGHYPSQAVDGDPNTHSLSAGKLANGERAHEYWEFALDGGRINQIYLLPWGGPYQCYISVRVNGTWQTGGGIPPPVSPGWTMQPYVTQLGLATETAIWVQLPTAYNADRIRIQLSNTQTGFQPAPSERSGLRTVKARYHSTGQDNIGSSAVAMATDRVGDGAWAISSTGSIFRLGDAPTVPTTGLTIDSAVVAAVHNNPNGVLFYILQASGRVNGLTTAGVINNAPPASGLNDFVGIAGNHNYSGYWTVQRAGTVRAFGSALHHGHSPVGGVAAILGDPTGSGYWIVSEVGQVYNFGTADALPWLPQPPGQVLTAAAVSFDGTGIWGLWNQGSVTTTGSAQNFGDASQFFNSADNPNTSFEAITVLPSNEGYRLLQRNGNIYYFGDAASFGDLGNTQGRTNGNYLDYADIVKDFLRWSGFLLFGTNAVHGNIQTTGAWSNEDLGEDVFDKKSIMDIITMIKQIVGYNFWIDDEGGVRFEQPNWFTPGNYFESGNRTTFVPTIDERQHLTSYSAQLDDSQIRSEVVIANAAPSNNNTTTITTKLTGESLPGASTLRGMCKPAVWYNEVFLRASEQQVMAELVALHVFFSMRQGQVECVGNPCIQLNDQLRIYERITSETYVHYIRSISTTHDLDTGMYKMQLGTNWLGDGTVWAITGGGQPGTGSPGPQPNEQSFAYVGAVRTFTVPSGVTSINVEGAGAQGEDGQGGLSTGGKGCFGSFTLTVNPGDTLSVFVGGQGQGGGPGGATDSLGNVLRGGAGGGSTRIFKPGVGQSTPPVDYMIIGGGGGGGGGSTQPGGGGIGIGNANFANNGGNAFPTGSVNYGGRGGTGATVTAHGTGGAGSSYSGSAAAGGAGNGATGGGYTATGAKGGSGGGGGQGAFNGGGGGAGVVDIALATASAGGGGGGGSSSVHSSATNVVFIPGFRSGHGYVKFSWTPPAPPPDPDPEPQGPVYQAENAQVVDN